MELPQWKYILDGCKDISQFWCEEDRGSEVISSDWVKETVTHHEGIGMS